MNCLECQNRLGDAGETPALEVAVHLVDCPACRAFHDTWAALDADLTLRAANVALPADFEAKLRARIPAPKPRLTPAEIAVRRAQYEREYSAAMAGYERWNFLLRPALLLRVLSVVGGSALGGLLLAAALPTLLEAGALMLRWMAQGTTELLLGLLALAGAALGLWFVRRPMLRQLPRW